MDASILQALLPPETGVRIQSVYVAQGLTGLQDAPRSGRPRSFSPAERLHVVTLASSQTEDHQQPDTSWSLDNIAFEILRDAHYRDLSRSTTRLLPPDLSLSPFGAFGTISSRVPRVRCPRNHDDFVTKVLHRMSCSGREPNRVEGSMDAKAVFEILIRENTDMLVAYIRAGVRDEHAVDDLYQETVLTAWKRLGDYDRNRPIGPWLRGIAGKIMLAFHRKSSRAAQLLDDQALEWLEARFEAIHSLRGDTFYEKLAALRECIDALPETYQQPITMRYNDQRALAEIESTLNLAKEALKKRLSRGKVLLAKCLEGKLRLAGTR